MGKLLIGAAGKKLLLMLEKTIDRAAGEKTIVNIAGEKNDC